MQLQQIVNCIVPRNIIQVNEHGIPSQTLIMVNANAQVVLHGVMYQEIVTMFVILLTEKHGMVQHVNVQLQVKHGQELIVLTNVHY